MIVALSSTSHIVMRTTIQRGCSIGHTYCRGISISHGQRTCWWPSRVSYDSLVTTVTILMPAPIMPLTGRHAKQLFPALLSSPKISALLTSMAIFLTSSSSVLRVCNTARQLISPYSIPYFVTGFKTCHSSVSKNRSKRKPSSENRA